MNSLNKFIGLYPVSKTLRFELRPVGKTKEHMDQMDFLASDEEKAEEYTKMKGFIDDYHRKFIDSVMSGLKLDWQGLYASLGEYKKKGNSDKKAKKSYEDEKKHMRELISNEFKKRPEFKQLFTEKLFSDILSKEAEENNNEEEKESLRKFNKFSGYFLGFHENRKNIYSNEDKHTALTYRLVSENFPKFQENCEKFQIIKKEMPEVVENFKKEISDLIAGDVEDYFQPNGFNMVLTQKGIDDYNTMLGGASEEDLTKIKGLNEYLNIYSQQNKGSKKIKMAQLYKMILAKSQSSSFVPRLFSNEEEVRGAVKEFYERIYVQLGVVKRIFAEYDKYDAAHIYVSQRDLTSISQILFKNWETLGGLMMEMKSNEVGDVNIEKNRKKIESWMSSKEFTLKEILLSIDDADDRVFREYSTRVSDIIDRIENHQKLSINHSTVEGFDGDKAAWTEDMKSFLDSVLDLQHLMKPFAASDDYELDQDFYGEFNESFSEISAIIPLYNKVRAFATKSDISKVKIKMNFANPTLADGWDLNKELDNTAVIFIRNDQYYLGIMNPKKKTDFKKLVNDGEKESYRKMVYKLLPGPNKMLPKVFFSDKGRKTFDVPPEIIEGYETGKHKLGEKFDLSYCHKLIDFFKENIPKYEGWDVFDFKFSPTESYSDISQFYKEVADQGYKISFDNIPVSDVDNLIEQGDLFLFQLYTKDFSEHSKGKKNLHTLYWNAAFSPENIKNVVVKINGEAELFYRHKSKDLKVVTHKAGSPIVNRTDKDGKPIPSDVYYDLFRYKTGQKKLDEISAEARSYLDRAVVSEAKYDIVKDRRFTEDKMFFHIPLTLNYKAPGNININDLSITRYINDPDVRIMGIDRGERNLIYYSIIDREGRIVRDENGRCMQGNFNIINSVDYHEKLDQRQKERQESRRSWASVEKIKDLKEGYISLVVHEISKMILKYNTVVVLEDLNFGFKRGRFKFEKQVYQKFEQMLIDKLNYLVFKDRGLNENGGVLRAYQLTDKFDSFQKLGKQTGILFYVPASYTSKIDPTTGFTDIFNMSSITNGQSRKEFLSKMKCISYNAEDGGFDFSFDYRDFQTYQTDHRNRWVVSTRGVRIKYNSKEKKNYTTDPTAEIIAALTEEGIVYDSGANILEKVTRGGSQALIDRMFYSFKDSLQMRNSDDSVDYIISPVKNRYGTYYVSGNDEGLPTDADANGAYHIALKGKMMLDQTVADEEGKSPKMPKLTNADWLEYVQKRWE